MIGTHTDIAWCTTGSLHGSLLTDDFGKTKVGKLDFIVFFGRLQQQIFGLEITMCNVEVVQVLQGENEFLCQNRGIFLGVRALGNNSVKELASSDTTLHCGVFVGWGGTNNLEQQQQEEEEE
jgi:hypothetical protein